VKAAAALAGLEAVALVAYAAAYVLEVLPFDDEVMVRSLMAGAVALFLLLAAAALGAAAWALLRLRHWPRSVLVMAQLLIAAVMVQFALDGRWLGWLFVAVALTVVAMVLAPRTTAAIER